MIRSTSQPGLHILVVDDNLVHRRMSQTILAAAGYKVTLAEGGAQALAAFGKSPADVVLLDIRMPGMDGFEVCRRLRALPAAKKVPILFLTDISDLDAPDQAIAVGGDDFLNKPINRIELVIRVRSLLRARHHEGILDGVLAESRESIVLLDGAGQITKWSPPAAELFGWPAGEVVGRSFSRLAFTAAHQPAFEEALTGYLSPGPGPLINQRTEWSAVHHSGRPLLIELRITAIHTANEVAFCAFIRDLGAPGARGAA